MNETPQVQENLGTIPAGDEHFSDASVAMPCGSDGGVACRGLHAPNNVSHPWWQLKPALSNIMTYLVHKTQVYCSSQHSSK